ncbi:MAG TPA: hypothetical protein VIL36_24080 [Acidimicrobiales bacterium]
MAEHRKVSPALEADVEQHDNGEPIEVVVELNPEPSPKSGTRGERIAQARAAFERQADAVRRTILAAGGEVLGSAWINQTLRTRLPKSLLEQLEGDDRVARLDVTRTLTAER